MTQQQRIDDFDMLCSHIENVVPTLCAYENLYGISYDETKAYYKNKIEKVSSDFEYYSLIQGFLYNIPSGHMTAGFPLISGIDEDFLVHLNKNESFVNAQSYWFETIHNECKKHYEAEAEKMIFAYYSGEYRGIAEDNNNDTYGINKATLLTVNGVKADEFIKLNALPCKLRYDHINQKPFRDTLVFNNIYGEECTVEYINEQGEKCREKMYYGTNAYYAVEYVDYFKSIDRVTSEDNVQNASSEKTDYVTIGDLALERNEEKNLLYIRIDRFESQQSYAEITENTIISYSEGIDNIIIDIRQNGGGYYEYADAVLSAISDKDIQTDSNIYVTERYFDTLANSPELYEFDKETGLYKTKCSKTIMGKAKEKKNVYLLVSERTGSAADNLAYEFKRNNLGTIIGTNNTGGERDGTICLNYNDISGIYYTYTAFAAMNPDGTFNSVEGTAPDIYVQQPLDAYFEREELLSEGEDPYSFDNCLKWDNILIKTLELIKEDENDKGNNIADE